jgi:hypothetical protein
MAAEMSRRSELQQQTIAEQGARLAQLEKELAERTEELKAMQLKNLSLGSSEATTTTASSTTSVEKSQAKTTPNSKYVCFLLLSSF